MLYHQSFLSALLLGRVLLVSGNQFLRGLAFRGPSIRGICDSETQVDFERRVFLDLVGDRDRVTADELELLALIFLTSFNDVALCEQSGAYFSITASDAIDPLLTDQETRSLLDDTTDTTMFASADFTLYLSVGGRCRGCDLDTALFDDVRRRSLFSSNKYGPTNHETEPQSVLRNLNTECSCPPPQVADFIAEYNEQLSAMVDAGRITSVVAARQATEITTVECGDATEFSSTAVLDASVDLAAATQEEISELERAILQTYNLENAYNADVCDPEFHVVTNVAIDLTSSIVLQGGEERSSLLVLFSGECRGCDANTTLFSTSYERGLSDNLSTHRMIQEGTQCGCAPGAVSSLPAQTDFVDALDARIDVLREQGTIAFVQDFEDIGEVEQVECSPDVDTFEASVLVELLIERGVQDEVIDALEDIFRESYNSLVERFCDPLFRRVIEVAFVGISSQDQRRSLSSDNSTLANSTLANSEENCTQTDHGNYTLAGNSTAESQNCTSDTDGFGSDDGSDSTDESLENAFPVLLEFSIFGFCRGCSFGTTLYNDVSDASAQARDLSLGDPIKLGNPHRRRLDEFAICFCDTNPVDDRAPTTDEFAVAFSESIAEFDLDGVQEVQAVQEVIVEESESSDDDSSETTTSPTRAPTNEPTSTTAAPTNPVTDEPTEMPDLTTPPTNPVTEEPTTMSPTTVSPTNRVTDAPTTTAPTNLATDEPTELRDTTVPPTDPVTDEPTPVPTTTPVTEEPTPVPTNAPTTAAPTPVPSEEDVSSEDVSEEDVSSEDVSEEDASEEDVSEEDASEEDVPEEEPTSVGPTLVPTDPETSSPFNVSEEDASEDDISSEENDLEADATEEEESDEDASDEDESDDDDASEEEESDDDASEEDV